MNEQKIGQRINAGLAASGMKQKDLAKILGVTDNTISYYCRGARTPKLEQLIQIAKTLNVTTDYLLGLTDDPSTHPCAVDALGLSSNTIQTIIDFRPDPNDPFKFWIPADTLNILDWLLSSNRHFFPLIFIFDKLRDEAKEMYAAKKAFDENSTAALRDAFIEAGDRAELTEYRATKEFSKLMEEYINAYCLHLTDPSEGEWRSVDNGHD